jgi:hypothetical protein
LIKCEIIVEKKYARGKHPNSQKALTPVKKGQVLNPYGQPRKYVSTLIKDGYKKAEVNDTIQALISMNINEVKAVLSNPNATVLEKTVSSALLKSMTKGDLSSIESLINRVYGKPKDHVETSGKQVIEIVRKNAGRA